MHLRPPPQRPGIHRQANPHPQTTGLAEWNAVSGLVDLVHWQYAHIVVPHQPVTCVLLDALGRTLWSADVEEPEPAASVVKDDLIHHQLEDCPDLLAVRRFWLGLLLQFP